MCRYRYHGEFPNQEISPKAGAYHSSEIPLLFGTSADTGRDTPSEVLLAKNMRHAWAEFAKDPVNGLVKLGWPVYNQTSELSP
jgi:cholinesterase